MPYAFTTGMERRQQEIRDERFRRTRNEIAARLGGVCAGMPDDERDALLDRMALIEIKYLLRRTEHMFAFDPEARDRS